MSYVVKLDNLNFDGPLDLLLQLINKAKIDIKDIFISNITEQFIMHLEQMKEMDMFVTSEFIEFAALLLEIKSRSLLPKIKEVEEEESPEELLIRRLEEYKACKELSEKLEVLAKENEGMVFRYPMEAEGARRVDIDFSFDALMEAFNDVLNRAASKVVVTESNSDIKRDTYTVQGALSKISGLIKIYKNIRFRELFESDTKEEVVVTFMAILELWKLNQIKIKQEGTFADIYITEG